MRCGSGSAPTGDRSRRAGATILNDRLWSALASPLAASRRSFLSRPRPRLGDDVERPRDEHDPPPPPPPRSPPSPRRPRLPPPSPPSSSSSSPPRAAPPPPASISRFFLRAFRRRRERRGGRRSLAPPRRRRGTDDRVRRRAVDLAEDALVVLIARRRDDDRQPGPVRAGERLVQRSKQRRRARPRVRAVRDQAPLLLVARVFVFFRGDELETPRASRRLQPASQRRVVERPDRRRVRRRAEVPVARPQPAPEAQKLERRHRKLRVSALVRSHEGERDAANDAASGMSRDAAERRVDRQVHDLAREREARSRRGRGSKPRLPRSFLGAVLVVLFLAPLHAP